jgi:TonB-linked SusC/RagA family outer membrane protein
MKVKLRLRALLFLQLIFLLTLTASAQDRTLTGTITGKLGGQPLAGATVSVKGTRTAVTTDDAGNFKINVAAQAKTLVISHVGMATLEVAIPSSGKLSIQLDASAASKMDEVVVVGYGTQRKSVVTGAISSVRASDLENQPVVRVEQALEGRTSGLTIASQTGAPGSAATVRLRGFTSFGNGKNDPLWVIDGVVTDAGGIGFLNQDDIESIEVLKDGASAAIYGTRAAAGVILITTKKGKSGTLKINYSGYYGLQAPEKKLSLMDATQYANMRNQAVLAANPGATAPFADPSSYGKGTDWQKLIFNDHAPKMNHELSISGGSDKSTFFTSFGYTDIQGQIATKVSRYTRMNYRINTNFRPAKFISFGENLGFEHGKTMGPGETNREYGGVVSSALNLDPITPAIVYDSVAQKNFVGNNPAQQPFATRTPQGYIYGISPYVGQEMKNPLAVIQNRLGNYSWDNNIVGNAYLDLTPVKGLLIHSSLGTKMAFYGAETYTPSVFYNNSNLAGPNSFSRNNNWIINWNVENTISYNRIFGSHNVTLLGGWGEYKDGNAYSSTVVYNNVIGATDFNSASFINGGLTTDRQNSTGSNGTDHRINSLFSRLQYNYDEKYLLTALIRRDGSSRFGENHKFGYFPSVSVGWVPTLENFFPRTNVINNLKIRGSYGVTGNDGIGDFTFIPTIGSGGQRNYQFGDTLHIGYSPNAPANPDLKWEQTSQLDFGLDAVLFNSLTFTVDVYKKKTTGILQTPAIPAYAGYGSFAQNFDDMENRGIEFEAGYRKKLGEFTLGLNGNISFYQNKVTKMLPGTTFFEDNSASFQTLGNITRSTLNQPYQRFYGYKILGIFQSQAQIDAYTGKDGVTKLQPKAKPGDLIFANLQNDNIIDANDRTYLGNPNPTVSFGLTVNLAYKQFDFTAFGGGSGGNRIFQGFRRLDIGTSNYLVKYQNAWTPTNTHTNLPRIVDGDPNQNYSKMTSLYLENGNYFKLRTVQIGYNLPKGMLNKWGCQHFRVYALVENLFTITKYSGFDPEIGVSPDAGGGAQYGIDRGAYVPARSFLVGVNVGF